MDLARERERKLEAHDGFQLPPLGGRPLEPRLFTSVYYDTPTASLAWAGITLRRRTENGAGVWQLKLPGDEARFELAQPGGPTRPPAELARLLVAHLRRGALAPVAELRTRRRGELVERKGTSAEVTVDEVAVMDALRVADEFVEVEIELRNGDGRELDRIARNVERAGAKPTNGTPKVFRALGLREAPDAGGGAFSTLHARLRAQLREILRHDPGTRVGADAEALHQMRVAVRRSRALLRTGRRLIRTDTAALAADLKWLGKALGDVRDVDVLLDRLRAEVEMLDLPDRGAATSLLRALVRERRRKRGVLLKALDGSRYLRLLDDFETTLEELEPRASSAGLAALARRHLKQLRRAAGELGDDPTDAALHDLRKRGKRARYAAELAGRSTVVKRAKALQDVLGEHQDSVVAEARLRVLALEAAPAEALAAGRLIELERKRRAAARRAWRDAWRRLDRAAS